MKNLLIPKLGLFFIFTLSLVTYILVKYGGNVDFFYEKFTTPKTKSMIIGDSRSFQGIHPQVMNSYLKNKGYDLPILNYSFTAGQAVSGPLYNASILKKIDTTARNGVFIISITPDFINSKFGFDNENGEFREANTPPHNMRFVTMNPNYEYLIKNISYFHFKALFRKGSTTHKDGWLEETNLPKDTLVLNNWRESQIRLFLKDRDLYKPSKLRINSLNDLVKQLKKYGEVYLIRMPISKRFLLLEDSYYPKFNTTIDSLSKMNSIKYFDFNLLGTNKYKTYDGHHVDKFAGKKFTLALCDSILLNKKK